MEYLGAAQSVAQSLFDALQNVALQEMCSVWGYESELEYLQRTVDTIKAVLLDAESKHEQGELSHQAQIWVDQLKDAIYDADDLLDKFVTLAEQKQLRTKEVEGDHLFKKVCRFFSFENPVLVAFNMSQEVKKVRNKLDTIALNHNQFGFKPDSQPIHRRREETCSYVYVQDVIGRKDDVENMVGRLLDPDVQQDVSCLTIVGTGGLGKTTLAQLIYNDPRIEQEFPLRLWTCISDEKSWDIKEILCKILESAKRHKVGDLSMDLLQSELREQVVGKKYFLVLDDVWNEERNKWLMLMEFLKGGLSGSLVLVTTRSRITATIVGGEVYDLKGLSDENSWLLFEKTAFGQDHNQTNKLELDQIGREIVKQCANVPLAIRVVGTALYGQDKKKWLSFQEVGLRRIMKGANGIEPILKLSYLHLEPQIRICFRYCAIFPKDFVIRKEMLIYLWIAQGYVVPFNKGQSIEDVGEEYFLILLRRCFLQNVGKDKSGEIISVKIHDLMHDVAQEVAGKEILEANSISRNLNNKIRHLFHLGRGEGTKSLFTGTNIRTYLGVGNSNPESPMALGTLLANWMSLRALDLSDSMMTHLPSTLDKLLHLRYLDLSDNHELEVLPNSITELHNVQILLLTGCVRLKELPKDLGKLTNLRVLDTTECRSLARLPRGVGKLSCLWKLSFFVVGEKPSKEKLQLADQLEEIKALKNLKGNLYIKIDIPTTAEYVVNNGRKGGHLSQHLTKITITFPEKNFEDVRTSGHGIDEALLEDLQPHSDLRGLNLEKYCGQRMPNWAREESLTIVNLVSLKLKYCPKLQHLSGLGKLHKLKSLELEGSNDLEYIENTTTSGNSSGVGALEFQESFFPSLESLSLENLPELKGWWRDDIDSNTNQQRALLLPSFPRLSHLRIVCCPNLASMPLCPSVEDLIIEDCNVGLQIMKTIEPGNSKLMSVRTDDVGHLRMALPMEAFQGLNDMTIMSDSEVEKLSEVEEVFHSCSSSLRNLAIWDCNNLKSLSGGLEHLTALEGLQLYSLPSLSVSKVGEGEGEGEEEDGMPMCCLRHSLRSLELCFLPKMVKLPNGMRYLTALQSLIIDRCPKLKSVPKWMPELTSLKQLIIRNYSEALRERCRNGTGEDWPNIQHIPDLQIFYC